MDKCVRGWNRRGASIGVALYAVVILAWPGDGVARTLTVDEAVTLALDHSLTIDAAEAGQDKAQADATAALLQFFPKASVSAGYTRLDQVPYMEFDTSSFFGSSGSGADPCAALTEDDIPPEWQTIPDSLEMFRGLCEMIMGWTTGGMEGLEGAQRLEMGLKDNFFVTGTLEQIVFAGGALHQGRAASMDIYRASQDQVRLARHDAAFAAEKGFYQLLAARGAVQVTAEAAQLVQAYVQDLQNLVDVGMASQADLLAAQVQLSQAQLDAMKMAHVGSLAEAMFKVQLGIPRDEPLELVMMEGQDVDALPRSADELLSLALAQRPDVAGLDHTLDAMMHASNATWASWMPAIVAMANLNARNPNYSLQQEWYPSADITLALSWSVWDRGAAIQGNRAARAARRQLDAQRQLLTEMMTVELEAAVSSYDESIAELSVAGEGLQRARESLRLEQERFREGVSNNIQLLQAQTDVSASELTVLQAETQMHISHAALRKAVGMEPEVSP